MKRFAIVLLITGLLIGALEGALRVFVPSSLEGVTRVALHIPDDESVEVNMPGWLILGALQGRANNVTITSDGVRLIDEVHAEVTLRMDSVPLVPAFGNINGGTMTITVPESDRDALLARLSDGIITASEADEGGLWVSGAVTQQHYEIPYLPEYAVGVSGRLVITAEEHDLITWLEDASFDTGIGHLPDYVWDGVTQERHLCLAERFPRGITFDGVSVNEDTGDVVLHANLSPTLMSSLNERILGDC